MLLLSFHTRAGRSACSAGRRLFRPGAGCGVVSVCLFLSVWIFFRPDSLLPCLLFLSLKIAMHIAYTQKIFLNELIWNINSQQKFYGRGNATFITCLLSYSFPPFLCYILIMGSATAYCIFQTQLYTG